MLVDIYAIPDKESNPTKEYNRAVATRDPRRRHMHRASPVHAL